MNDNTSALVALSAGLAGAVASIAPAIVYVDAHPRRDASGIAWDAHHVVTVDHAIDREEDIELRMDDVRAEATLVGRDPSTDVSLLHTSATLTPAVRAQIEDLAIGHLALAVGRDEDGALGASFGAISALDGPWRTWRGGDVERFIRPGLNLYAGFSGGALIDPSGSLVGMNTTGLSRRHALTLPWTTLARVIADLLQGGRVRRGYLGVAVHGVRLPGALRAARGLSQHGGAIVVDVAPDGPAERAGIAMGDVIVSLAGVRVEDADDVHRALGAAKLGEVASLAILRGGEARTIDAVIAERQSDDD